VNVRRRVDDLAAGHRCPACDGTGVAQPPWPATDGAPAVEPPKVPSIRERIYAAVGDVKSRLPDPLGDDDEARVVHLLARLDPATSPRATTACVGFLGRRTNGHDHERRTEEMDR
jgi:hypothetical protein